MFPDYIMDNENSHIIHDFITGEMPIADFVELLHKDDSIFQYLQSIVDYLAENDIFPKQRPILVANQLRGQRSYVEDVILKYRYSSPVIYPFDRNYCPTVKEDLKHHSHKTAHGALSIHSAIADIYYQVDSETIKTEQYADVYSFILDVIPSYLCGPEAEAYISEYLISSLPDDMSKSAKKKIVREEIRKLFKRQTKGYPRWIQSPEWPIGINNKPMTFVKQVNCKAKSEHDDYSEYYFIDEETSNEKIVRQYY